jgi:hypothetical protein
MKKIMIYEYAGSFAENKDVARDLRIQQIIPSLDIKEDVTLDFSGVDSATQSFIHALLSDVIRKKGVESIDHMYFENCTETVQKIITIVMDYMQEAL